MRIRFSDEALWDLNDGFQFYDAQQSGLGDYFVSCLRADIEGGFASQLACTVLFTGTTTDC